jgi:Tol biopolymer transport system component
VGTGTTGDPFAVGRSAIYVVDVADGRPRRIAEDFTVARNPVWSPDGRAILFAGNREPVEVWGRIDWWTASLDGGLDRIGRPLSPEQPAVPLAWPSPGEVWAFQRPSVGDDRLVRVSLADRREVDRTPRLERGARLFAPARGTGGTMVFASSHERVGVWLLPIAAEEGRATGELRSPVSSSNAVTYPLLSDDGKWFAFREGEGSDARIAWMNLDTRETRTRSGEVHLTPLALTRDGQQLVYSDAGPSARTELLSRTAASPIYSIWHEGITWDVSAHGQHLLRHRMGSQPRAIEVVHMATGSAVSILEDPEWNLYLSAWSPDERWVAFEAIWGIEERIFVAPFLGNRRIPAEAWIDVGRGTCPRWSPDGGRVYFLARHDGQRCLYSRRVDRTTRRPIGDAEAVHHFHQPTLSPDNVRPGLFRFSVARDKLAVVLGERRSNIYALHDWR